MTDTKPTVTREHPPQSDLFVVVDEQGTVCEHYACEEVARLEASGVPGARVFCYVPAGSPRLQSDMQRIREKLAYERGKAEAPDLSRVWLQGYAAGKCDECETVNPYLDRKAEAPERVAQPLGLPQLETERAEAFLLAQGIDPASLDEHPLSAEQARGLIAGYKRATRRPLSVGALKGGSR